MEHSDDKHWASRYLLDPLNEPEPSTETGPGSHFRSTVAPVKNEARDKEATSNVSEVGAYPTPPHSASPTRTRFQSSKLGNEESKNRASTAIPTSSRSSAIGSTVPTENNGRGRNSSLSARFPGNDSNRPLDMIRKSSLRAQRSPHLRKDHHHGIDSIDRLGGGISAFHVSGPFDAVSQARNISPRDSPVAALKSTNAEALRATPREAVIDALRHHRPLDNIATLPPGMPARDGTVLNYREGDNMQRGLGQNGIVRFPAQYDYDRDDIRRNESGFTYEQDLKRLGHNVGHKGHGRATSEGIEMTPHHRTSMGDNNPFSPRARASSGAAASGREQSYSEWESGIIRSKSAKGSLSRKLGSLRRRHHAASEN